MPEIPDADASAPAQTGTSEWAIVELMGHRRRAGRVSEVERFGTKLLRIDIPVGPSTIPVTGTYVTEFYGGSAIYAMRPATEAVARALAEQLGDPRPVAPTSLRLQHARAGYETYEERWF